jgi:hypothetical protein
MITKKDLQQYEVESLNEYFYLIDNSVINGQFRQAKGFIKELSKPQQKEMILDVLSNKKCYSTDSDKLIQMILEYI